MIDTNNFTTRAGVRTFEAAAFLRRSGADVTRVRKLLRDDLKSYQARAEAVRTAQIYRECYAIARCPSENLVQHIYQEPHPHLRYPEHLQGSWHLAPECSRVLHNSTGAWTAYTSCDRSKNHS